MKMDFVSRHFIALNAVVVILLFVSFMRMRASTRQKLMRLREPPTRQIVVERVVVKDDDPRAKRAAAVAAARESALVAAGGGAKTLNVMFNYNGHTWDAYEVLGVPAGSNFENSFLAFEKLTREMDEESKSFMLAALEAIRVQRQFDS